MACAESGDRASTGGWRDAVGIGPADDELVAIDVCVVDAAGVEMFADRGGRRASWISTGSFSGPQLLVERDQELPLGGHTSHRF